MLQDLQSLFGQRAKDKPLSLQVQWEPETPRFAFRYADETTGKAAESQNAIDPELLLRQRQHAVLRLDLRRTTELANQFSACGFWARFGNCVMSSG